MRNISLLCGLLLLLGALAVAQEFPKDEAYIAYSFVRVAPQNNVNAFNSNGGLGQLQYNINEHIGIVADLGGYTNGNITGRGITFPGDQSQFTYLFGPRLSINKTGKVTPFFEFEVGGVHNARSFSVPTSAIPAGLIVPKDITVEAGSPGFTKFRSTQNAFAMAIGGGLEVKVKRWIAVRPIQLDYLPSHFSPFNFSRTPGSITSIVDNSTQWQHNLRYSAGITFRFSEPKF
jgi:opacity protein-like surface antigen